MEIAEFASTILHTTELGEKLWTPDSFTDHNPGSGYSGVVSTPGRSQALGFGGERTPFPSRSNLDKPEAQGQVFHFFANHELLALELMALALIRFPEMPRPFRLGLVDTMRDEQRHLRLYLQAMEQKGVALGDIHCSDFFWKCLSPMRDPLEFLAGMSMTFEQANLDFAKHYMNEFAHVGADFEAGILRDVYEDEIKHVGFGYAWFNRLDKQLGTVWQRYNRSLRFPLTPRRARGIGFDREARRRAGLDRDFISEVELFQHTRGRSARLFFFNPDCEEQVARGLPGYSANQRIESFRKDYASCMMFLAGGDDVVVVDDLPSKSYQRELRRFGFELPEFISESSLKASLPYNRSFDRLVPWGMSAEVVRRSEDWRGDLQSSCDLDFSERRDLFRKSWHVQLRQLFCDEARAQHFDLGLTSVVCRSIERLRSFCDEWTESGISDAVLKSEFGASGRNQLKIRIGEALSEPQKHWVRKHIALHGAIVAEPWVDRIADFGMQIKVSAQHSKLLGLTRFLVSNQGQQMGHWLGDALEGIEGRRRGEIRTVLSEAALFAGGQLALHGFEGYAGVDAFLYRTPDGVCLNPIVEVNPRYTLGHIALKIKRRMSRSSWGWWRHLSAQEWEKPGGAPATLRELQESHPLIEDGGFIQQGVFATNDPSLCRTSLGIVRVGSGPTPSFSHSF